MAKRKKATDDIPKLVVIADKITVARKWIKEHNVYATPVTSHTDLVAVEREHGDNYEWVKVGVRTTKVESISFNALCHAGQRCRDFSAYAKPAPSTK